LELSNRGGVDVILTDPPYGVGRDKGFDRFRGFSGFGAPISPRCFEDDEWDSDRPDAETLRLCASVAPLAVIWGGNFFADVLPRSTHWIFWDKLQTMPTFGDGELAWTSSPRKSVVKVTIEWNGLLGKEETRWHPTQKPLDLMLWCLEHYSQPGHLVVDPFLGSGTMLRAAKDLGRRGIGCDREEKYCEVAARKMQQESLPLVARKNTLDAELGLA